MRTNSSMDPDTRQGRRLKRLERKAMSLWRTMNQCEALYRELGLAYHCMPVLVRQLFINQQGTDTLKNCQRAFVITNDEDPQIIQDMHQLRKAKSEAWCALRAAAGRYLPQESEKMWVELTIAKRSMEEIDELVDDVKDALLIIEQVLQNHRLSLIHI